MNSQVSPDKTFDTKYVQNLLDTHTSSIRHLAETALELGLKTHASSLNKEAWQARIGVGTKYLGTVGNGLIDDIELAHELALIQDPYEEAAQAIATLAIDTTIKAGLIEKTRNDSKTEQSELIREYHAFMRAFINTHSTPSGIEVPSSLEQLTPEQIKNLFDTSPVNKHDFLTSGTSVSHTGRIWNALVSYHIDYKELVYEGGVQVSNPAPTIEFNTFNSRSYADRDSYEDIDFTSLYILAEWIDTEVDTNNRKIKSILGNGTGKGTMLGIRQLIASRKTADTSEG